MKTKLKALVFIFIASFLFMGGCVKNITSVKFDYQSEASFLTDSLLTIGNQTFDSTVVSSGLSAELDKNGATLDMLDALKLKTAEISFEMPDSTDNFDKIESVELWLSTDAVPAVKVASKSLIGKGLTSVKMDVAKNDNLANYFKAGSFTYSLKGKNNAPLSPMNLKVNANYEVKASSK